MDYEVHWGDGPLGLTLRPDLGEDMPPVVGRITRLDSAAALANVAVGHMLVSINGIETARQGYDHVVSMLQKIPRPATLRFRVPQRADRFGLSSSANSHASSSSHAMPSLPPDYRKRSERHLRTNVDRTSAVSSASDPGAQRSSSREQYMIVWTEGPLGMILQPDKDDCHVPCIRKITGKGVGTGMDRATVGDILVAVNGQETKSLGFRSTISLLKTIRKPAVLKFKRMRRTLARTPSYMDSPGLQTIPQAVAIVTPPIDVSVYDIVWREGDLGLKLKPGRHDVPQLSKLTGKGNASGLQFASIGDELVSVNGSPVEGEAYQDTLRMLKHSPKPAVLRFRRVAMRTSSSTTDGSYMRHNMSSAASTTSSSSSSRRVHEPVYAAAAAAAAAPRGPGDREHSQQYPPGGGGNVHKKKRKIPLHIAKEVVTDSLNLPDGSLAVFAGMPIHLIEENTPQAHLLRKEAKLCITGGERPPKSSSSSDRSALAAAIAHAHAPLSSGASSSAATATTNAAAKESLLRAEQEALVLQQALEKVKSQAKKYEEILGTQKREHLLASATRNKSQEVVGRQNNMIAELSTVISGFRRESYTELEVVVPVMDDEDHQSLMDDLENVMNIPVVVPVAKYCAECGATESESPLDLDDDGQYYCKDCWEKFLTTGESHAHHADMALAPVALPGLVPPPAPVSAPAPVVVQLPEPEAPPSRSLARRTSENKALDEQNARLEAERKLLELTELRHSGRIPSPIERQPSLTAVDRTKRDRRGLEEFARALREEEERARADGNNVLAKKLSAQIARIEADAGVSAATPSENDADAADTPAPPSSSSLYRNGHSGSSPGIVRSGSSSGTHSPVAVASSLKRGASVDGATMLAHLQLANAPGSTSSTPPKSPVPPPAAAPVVVEAPVVEAPAPVVEPTTTNDYDDVNSDEEADDHVVLDDDEATDNVGSGNGAFLREVEEKNFALARQLDEAHSVVERARMSLMLSGSDDEGGDDFGLSDEQIRLFKKLTTQAEERASTVDRLHPEDDSDSDSDDGSEMGDEDEEDEEDDGVWI